jgi:hypothetical protein
VRPYLKNTQHKKRAGRVVQVAECLPSKHEALSSNPYHPPQNKNKNKNKNQGGVYGRRENNGGDEPNEGKIHVHMEMSQQNPV